MFQGSFVLIDDATKSYAMRISGLTSGSGGVPIETSIPVSARVTSTLATNKATTPAAGATIATLTVPASGTYEIEVTTFIAGTTVANTEIDNMELFINGASAGKLVSAVPGTTGATDASKYRFKYDGNGTIAVKANALATTGAIYAATIIANRIN